MTSTISAPMRALLVAALVLLVGSAILQAASPEGRSDPVASIENGGPRGLLLLALALRQAGADVQRATSDAELEAAIGAARERVTIVVPPPEQAAFSVAEAKRLVAAADVGHRVVIACDPKSERRKRLLPIFGSLGARCVDQGELPATTATLALPATTASTSARLFVRDGGRVGIDEAAAGVVVVGADDNDGVVAAVIGRGAGDIVVFGSTSSLSNDGLAEADNAAAAFALLAPAGAAGTRIIVDERHHQTRGTLAIQAASAKGAGPMTALLCALLMIPLTLLSLAPRRGELLENAAPEVPAASARVRGLAALMAATGAPQPSAPDAKPTSPHTS